MYMDASVRINLSEIKYEVKFDSWLKEKIVNAEAENAQSGHKAVDYAYKSDKAEDWLIRQITDAIDELHGELRWCVHEDDRMTSDEITEAPDYWEVHFRFGRGWRGSMRALKKHIHAYVVAYVLGKWYRISQPSVAPAYMEEAAGELNKAYTEARNEIIDIEPWTL